MRGALAEAGAAIAADQAEAAGEQLDMLQAPSRFDGEVGERQRRTLIEHHRARGRPPGARNVATREMLAFLRARGLDPMEQRFRWAMHTPETLAKELNCTLLDAFDRLEGLWRDLTRYFYAPMAPVDGHGNPVVPNFAMFIGGQAVGQGGGLPAWLTDPEVRKRLEIEQANQALSREATDVSDAGKSDDAPSV